VPLSTARFLLPMARECQRPLFRRLSRLAQPDALRLAEWARIARPAGPSTTRPGVRCQGSTPGTRPPGPSCIRHTHATTSTDGAVALSRFGAPDAWKRQQGLMLVENVHHLHRTAAIRGSRAQPASDVCIRCNPGPPGPGAPPLAGTRPDARARPDPPAGQSTGPAGWRGLVPLTPGCPPRVR
jgi:hypothetical protein